LFKAGLVLELGKNVGQARELGAEARAISPEADASFLETLIAYYDKGPSAALDSLACPTTPETHNLRAALLLELQRPGEALAALQSLAQEIRNEETDRLHALSLLLTGNVAAAQVEIAKAIAKRPHWFNIRLTKAIIDYASALSPAVIPRQLPSWPDPVELHFIKQDDESIARMRAAQDAFYELSNITHDSHLRQLLQTWHLASLANDPEKKQDAQAYCGALLANGSPHYYALIWGISRGFKIDYLKNVNTLLRLIGTKKEGLEAALALLTFYMSTKQAPKALKLLDKTKSAFKNRNALSLWHYWRAQALVETGDERAALDTAEEAADPEVIRLVRKDVLEAQVRKSGDRRALSEHLYSSFKETGQGTYLWEYCKAKAASNEWQDVATCADDLLALVGTSDALKVAAVAMFNARRPNDCLSLLDRHRDFFLHGTLPTDMCHLRIQCLRLAGALPRALSTAEAIALEDPSTDNLVMFMDILLAKGDLDRLAVAAKRLAKIRT